MERILIAHLPDRTPIQPRGVPEMPDTIPWARPYVPGQPEPAIEYPKEGDYVLRGHVFGHASVSVYENKDKTAIEKVSVVYHNFSDDGTNFLDGIQAVNGTIEHITSIRLKWYSRLLQTGTWGEVKSSQATSDGGFQMSIDMMSNIFEANGTLETTVDGWTFTQPRNGQ